MSEANVKESLPPRIGERTLTDSNLKLVLPNAEDVYTLVSQIRNRAQSVTSGEKTEKVDSNNVIGILGERGSGKSSVLLTVREKLKEKENSERDIFLNMIVPEMLEDSSDILGVVLLNFNTYIEDHREEILGYYRSQRQTGGSQQGKGTAFDNCLYIDKTNLDNLWNKVFTAYVYRTKNLQKVVEENFAGVAHFKEERKEALGSELELRERLQDFFDEIIKIWRDQNKNAPLVFICFDDADLNPKRCYEVLNIILKYLNHPNIVTFISGDILKFEEDIVGELLQQQNLELLNEKLVPERTVLESQQELVYDFLKKIMPYSQRFSLKKLSAQDKMNFKVSDDGDGSISFKQILDRSFEEGKAPYVCEDLKQREEGGVDAPLLFDIFDSKPRGLLTLYSYLAGEKRFDFDQTDGTQDKNSQRNSVMLLAYYQKLFEMVLETNSTLRKYKKWIETLFTLNVKTDLSGISVDIYHNRFQFEVSKDMEKNNKWREEMILIVHFLYFVESMVTRNVTSISGRMYQQDLQNSIGMAKDQSLLPRIQNARIIFALYSKLSIDFNIEQMKDVFNKKSYTNRYKELIKFYFEDEDKPDKSYKSLFAEDTMWLQNYERITEEKGLELFAIKNKILEDFFGFEFDFEILDDLKLNDSLIKESLNVSNISEKEQQESDYSKKWGIKEPKENKDELSTKFKDLSLYSFLLRMTGGIKGKRAEFDSTWSVELRNKLQAAYDIMYKNQFFMNLENISEFEKAHIKERSISNNDALNVEITKQKLTSLAGFLREEISISIATRSTYNEKILRNRIGSLVVVEFKNADEVKSTLKEDHVLAASDELFEFDVKSTINENSTSGWMCEHSDEWKNHYEDFRIIANGYEDSKYSNNKDLIYTHPDMYSATSTKARNAFNQLMKIKFLTLLLGEVNELIDEVESNWSLILIEDLEEKYPNDITNNMSDQLRLYFDQIQVNHYIDLKSIVYPEKNDGLFDGRVRLYQVKNKLESKFSDLKYHYETNEVNLKVIAQLMNKVSDATLITELKSIQRRLLVEGKISEKVLDEFEQRIKIYIQRLKEQDPRSYTVIELENLWSGKLGNRKKLSSIGTEIERIKNDIQERLCNQELVLLIKAFAQYYRDRPELLQGAE